MESKLEFKEYFGDLKENEKRDLSEFENIGTFFKNTTEIYHSIISHEEYVKHKQREYHNSPEFRELILKKKKEQELDDTPKERLKKIQQINKSRRQRKPTKAEIKNGKKKKTTTRRKKK